jgi:hypothetical protein
MIVEVVACFRVKVLRQLRSSMESALSCQKCLFAASLNSRRKRFSTTAASRLPTSPIIVAARCPPSPVTILSRGPRSRSSTPCYSMDSSATAVGVRGVEIKPLSQDEAHTRLDEIRQLGWIAPQWEDATIDAICVVERKYAGLVMQPGCTSTTCT